MNKAILFVILIFFLVSGTNVSGQGLVSDSTKRTEDLKFRYSALIIPVALIGYGAVGLGSDGLKNWNIVVRRSLSADINNRVSIDNYMQYAPFLSVYGLNAIGIKGKNNFKGRTVVLATAYLIMGVTVKGLKLATKVKRPDGNSDNSFPSGHTATAFMGAEFLRQEYKDVSPWYGIAGYVVATGIGFLRVYNNKHWLTDVAAGAGIGMLSTKAAYWMHPFVDRKLFEKNKKHQTTTIVCPYYSKEQAGFAMLLNF